MLFFSYNPHFLMPVIGDGQSNGTTQENLIYSFFVFKTESLNANHI